MISNYPGSEALSPASRNPAVPPAYIDLPSLTAQLSERARGWRIEAVAETGSTNTDLITHLRNVHRLSAPLVRAAYVQTAGRGRLGRRWFAAPGDALLFSVGCIVPRSLDGLAGLSLAAGVAIICGLRALPLSDEPSNKPLNRPLSKPQLTLKWPNDVLLNGAKLAGILVETAWSEADRSAVVIGVGVNLRSAAGPAAQISAGQPRNSELGAPAPAALERAWPAVEITATFARLLNALAEMLERFGAAGFAPFRERWNANHAYTGQAVSLFEQDSEVLRGIAGGVDARGRLLIDCGAAGVRAVASGDLSLRLSEEKTAGAFCDARSQ